ncbi:MAG: hypothetical protein JXC33_03170 [Deltaproteobacteria bacterium]|nr:hypothetical protein [Deltaproteobacteria bacterium]
MTLRWSLLLTVCLLFLSSAPANGQNDKHLSKKNALGLKLGYHFYLTSDLMDYWLMEEEDYNSAVGELSYEFKLSNYVSIYFSFCFFETDNNYTTTKRISGTGYYIDMYPSSNLKVRNFFCPHLLRHIFPSMNYFCSMPESGRTMDTLKPIFTGDVMLITELLPNNSAFVNLMSITLSDITDLRESNIISIGNHRFMGIMMPLSVWFSSTSIHP